MRAQARACGFGDFSLTLQVARGVHAPSLLKRNLMPVFMKRLSACALLCLFTVLALAQQNSLYNRYIDQYKDLAVEQMARYRIPASITLAQGLLESGAGQSVLARKANNHFGIKCGTGWTGKYIRQDDDRKGEKFRAYNSPRESYEDHSLFLTTRAHYASLFSLKLTDYKGWAHGLKKAGYATNPLYAHRLIKIIEDYDLAQYDRLSVATAPASASTGSRVSGQGASVVASSAGSSQAQAGGELLIRRCNKNYYVTARQGDTFASISRLMGVSARKLRRYNEVGKKHVLQAGDIVYLEKKRSKAEKRWKKKYHVVEAGQSLYTVSQIYGMKMKTLYKLNGLDESYRATAGDRLRIR